MQPIPTASEITANIIIQPLRRIPLYQKISKKVAELHLLGMSCKDITKSLNISIRILHETDKAILVDNERKLWIPKSWIYKIRLRNISFEIYTKENTAG